MAYTAFGALSAAQKKVWSAEIWMAARDSSFWATNGFMSNGINSPIQIIKDLTRTERGDECIMQLVPDLVEDGQAGDNMLEGNEEAMYNDAISIKIDQLRHGVKSRGQMDEQRTVIRFREQGRDKLGYWASRVTDEMMFLTAAGIAFTKKLNGATRSSLQLSSLTFAADVTAPSSGRALYAGSATSTASLTTSDTMTWNLVIKAQAWAKRKKIKPIMAGGKEYYAMVMSTEQARDLKRDSTYQTNVGRAGAQGPDHPLFRNAMATIDGVVLYEHNRVPTTLGLVSGSTKWGAGSNVDGAQALLLGAQALGFAELAGPSYQESDNTDYKNRPGMAVGLMMGMIKPQFTSVEDSNTKQDFGVVSVYTAAYETV